ncbi:hypothetical protein [Streptomyces sp. Ac-502]|uniref:hypothetical protein n=1 Tax=Streptomyces sp. Ac-502 TaxID=3342801 RepID=UPI003862C172
MSAYGTEAAPGSTDATLAALAAHGPRYRLGLGTPPDGEPGWLAADRLLDPNGPELSHLLDTEHQGSGHRTAHAAALTLIAVYAGRVTAAAVLHWALTGRVLDVRPENVLLRPDPGHGIAGVRMRTFRILDEPGTAAETLQSVVLTHHLLPLADALRERTRAGLRQLRGEWPTAARPPSGPPAPIRHCWPAAGPPSWTGRPAPSPPSAMWSPSHATTAPRAWSTSAGPAASSTRAPKPCAVSAAA